jgi:hypothetical protein
MRGSRLLKVNEWIVTNPCFFGSGVWLFLRASLATKSTGFPFLRDMDPNTKESDPSSSIANSKNMLIQIPREQLEKLLKDAGSNQTIEQFLNQAEIQTAVQTHELYGKRAKAARWSRIWLLASALFSAISFLVSPNPEDAISTILLGGMTVLEFKIHTWFLQADPRGPLWGYRNQSLFALLFIAYGAYHVLVPTPNQELEELGAGNLSGSIRSLEQTFYATIGTVGAIGQYALALYYRRATKTLRPGNR